MSENPYRGHTDYVDPLEFKRMRDRMQKYERIHDSNVRRMNKLHGRVQWMVWPGLFLTVTATVLWISWLWMVTP